MTNKKSIGQKAFFVLNIFEDMYFPETFCDVIVFKRQNQVCNVYLCLNNVNCTF